MKRFDLRLWSGVAAAMLLFLCPAEWLSGEEPSPVQVTIYPAAEPSPALRYHLLPTFDRRINGNAAVYYGKVTAEQISFFSNNELLEKIETWRAAPLEELRQPEVELNLGSIVYYLDRAARCKYADWQLPIGEEPFFEILLPDLQQTRQFARILATKSRIHIARGQYPEALQSLQSGFAIGRHVAEGETLINGLVGIACSSLMAEQVLTLTQQKDAPNLYWALTRLPQPLIDLRKGIEAESSALVFTFPDLRDLEDPSRTPEQWRELLLKFWTGVTKLVGDSGAGKNIFSRPEALTAISLRGYPLAKRGLVERGFSAETVEAMPVAQVILLYTLRQFEELRDELFKWFYVPYAEGLPGAKAAEEQLQATRKEFSEVLPVASLLLPAIGSVRSAVVRLDRQIAALRVIEALRMYGASHDGRLPEKLADITQVPMPLDPTTDQPFAYRLDGDTAHLESPVLRGQTLHYEIRMVKE